MYMTLFYFTMEHDHELLSVENFNPSRPRLDAIVTVAMCGMTATEMVRALRTVGGWKGPIYIITEKSDPSGAPEDYTILNVDGNHPKFWPAG